MFSKNIYPEAYMKLLIEEISKRHPIHAKVFSSKEEEYINYVITNLLIVYGLYVASNEIIKLGWEAEKVSYMYSQAYIRVLYQYGLTDPQIDNKLDDNMKLLNSIIEFCDKLNINEIDYGIFSYASSNIISVLKIDIDSDKSEILRLLVKDSIKWLDKCNKQILKKYRIKD